MSKSTPQPIAGVLARSRLVIHRGGHGLAAEALAAGVPQLALADNIEHDLYGEAIERAGVGRLVKTYLPDTRLESDAIQSLIDDDAMAARAATIGGRLREFTARHDALMNCEAVCMGLLKGSSRLTRPIRAAAGYSRCFASSIACHTDTACRACRCGGCHRPTARRRWR